MYCDNKALVNLLKRPSSKLPLRIERMLLQLQGYEFEIEYVKSESNISDFISRHPIQDKRQIDENIYEKYVNFVTTTAVPKSLTTDDISTATKQDKFLQNLRQRIENNDWNLLEKLNFDNETFNLLKRYRKFKDTLTINLISCIREFKRQKLLCEVKSFYSVWTMLSKTKLLIVYHVKQLVDPTLHQ